MSDTGGSVGPEGRATVEARLADKGRIAKQEEEKQQ